LTSSTSCFCVIRHRMLAARIANSVSPACQVELFRVLISAFLADRTATQYDRLLASSCRLFVCLSVRLSVCNALWLSESVYRAKSCTSVFLAGEFLFVPSDTFATYSRLCIVQNAPKNESRTRTGHLRVDCCYLSYLCIYSAA